MNCMLGQFNKKWLGVLPAFDPKQGVTIFPPEQEGPGWWIGAPSVTRDPIGNSWYLYARIRRPQPERGAACIISKSTDGTTFTEVWRCTKEQLNSESIERSSLIYGTDGIWKLYISYVNRQTRKWQIDLVEADCPENLDVTRRVTVLQPDAVNAEGVKDPHVIIMGGLYVMYLSVADRVDVTPDKEEARHKTGDIFNTGLTRGYTGLAISTDGKSYRWKGPVITPKEGTWFRYGTRIAAVVPFCGGIAAYFDGTKTVEENYEEQTGIAAGFSPEQMEILSESSPVLKSPWGTGSLRYIDIIPVDDGTWRIFYELARDDGSHELRMNEVSMTD